MKNYNNKNTGHKGKQYTDREKLEYYQQRLIVVSDELKFVVDRILQLEDKIFAAEAAKNMKKINPRKQP